MVFLGKRSDVIEQGVVGAVGSTATVVDDAVEVVDGAVEEEKKSHNISD